MPADPNELIHIKHPQIQGYGGPVTRQALDALWTHKGWSEASPEEVAKAEQKAFADSLKSESAPDSAASTAGRK